MIELTFYWYQVIWIKLTIGWSVGCCVSHYDDVVIFAEQIRTNASKTEINMM